MKLTIKNQETELKFGIKFALEMDKLYTYDNGIGEVATGLLYHVENIQLRASKSSLVLILLVAARTTLKDNSITEDDICDAIDMVGDFDSFFEQSKTTLSNLSVVQSSRKEAMELMERTKQALELSKEQEKQQK